VAVRVCCPALFLFFYCSSRNFQAGVNSIWSFFPFFSLRVFFPVLFFVTIVAPFKEEEINKCEGVECKKLPCKVERCNPLTGKCLYSNAIDGTECKGGKCKDGVCVPIAVVPSTPTPSQSPSVTPTGQGNALSWAPVVMVVLAIIAAIAYYLYIKKEGKKTPLEKIEKKQKILEKHEKKQKKP